MKILMTKEDTSLRMVSILQKNNYSIEGMGNSGDTLSCNIICELHVSI